jgi:hypothetical protein
MSLRSTTVDGVLRFDVINRSEKPVYSYDYRWYSPKLQGNGSHGAFADPIEGSLPPGHSTFGSIGAEEYFDLTLTLDFVLFADGSTWCSTAPEASVKPKGVEKGAQAAASYLRNVLNRDGAEAVMHTLPQIFVDVEEPLGSDTKSEFGMFGFYNGVTSIAVQVQHAYKEGGLKRVEALLQSYP